MNRQQRPVQAAKYRADLRRVKSMPEGTLPPEMMHDFFKGIMYQLDQLELRGLSDIGGHCILRALAAYQAVRANGIDCSIGFGGLVLRVGPDERRDTVAFCGPGNLGMTGTNGFHCWGPLPRLDI